MRRLLCFSALLLTGLFGCASCGNLAAPPSDDSGVPAVVTSAMHWPGGMVPVGYGASLRQLIRDEAPPFTPDLMSELDGLLALHHERQSKSQYPYLEVGMRLGLMFPWDGTGDIDVRSRTRGAGTVQETADGQVVEFEDFVRANANGETSVVTRRWKFTLKKSGRRMLVDDAEFEASSIHEGRPEPPLLTRWGLRRKVAELKLLLQPHSS